MSMAFEAMKRSIATAASRIGQADELARHGPIEKAVDLFPTSPSESTAGMLVDVQASLARSGVRGTNALSRKVEDAAQFALAVEGPRAYNPFAADNLRVYISEARRAIAPVNDAFAGARTLDDAVANFRQSHGLLARLFH